MTLNELVTEYRFLPKICAATDYSQKESLEANNKAVLRMYEIAVLIREFGAEGTKAFSTLLDIYEDKTNVWAATHLLEKLSFDDATGVRALQILEEVASGNDLTAEGYRMWLKDYKKWSIG